MPKLTNEQWKKIEEKIQYLPSYVNLLVDGYKITIAFERISKLKNGYQIYIDKQIKCKWLIEECEERKRFYRPISKYIHSGKTRNSKLTKKDKIAIEKILGVNFDEKYTYYLPDWTSFRSLKNHLIKNNENIELVEEDFNEYRC